MTHPHAYADITIHNGQIQSQTCIEKQPGINNNINNAELPVNKTEHIKFTLIGVSMQAVVRHAAKGNNLELANA